MCAWQQTDFNSYRANSGCVATINPNAGFKNIIPHAFVFYISNKTFNLFFAACIVICQTCYHIILDLGHSSITLLLGFNLESLGNTVKGQFLYLVPQLFINHRSRNLTLDYIYLSGQFLLCCKNPLYRILCKENSLKQIFFRDKIGLTFNHKNGVFAGCNNNLQIAPLKLFNAWVGNQPAIHTAHLYTGNWPVKRYIRYHQSCGCANH